MAVREKGRSASGAFYFRPTLGPIGARKTTRSAARMTTLATSAGTSAGEARRDAFGSDLGLCWPPLGSHRDIGFGEKEATPERYFHNYIYTGQSKSEERRFSAHDSHIRNYRSTGAPGFARTCPDLRVKPTRSQAYSSRAGTLEGSRLAKHKLPQTTTTSSNMVPPRAPKTPF